MASENVINYMMPGVMLFCVVALICVWVIDGNRAAAANKTIVLTITFVAALSLDLVLGDVQAKAGALFAFLSRL